MMNLFESAVDDMTQKNSWIFKVEKSATTVHYRKHQVYYYFHRSCPCVLVCTTS